MAFLLFIYKKAPISKYFRPDAASGVKKDILHFLRILYSKKKNCCWLLKQYFSQSYRIK